MDGHLHVDAMGAVHKARSATSSAAQPAREPDSNNGKRDIFWCLRKPFKTLARLIHDVDAAHSAASPGKQVNGKGQEPGQEAAEQAVHDTSAPVQLPGSYAGTNGEGAARAAMPAELHMAAPQPRLSRHQQQALLVLGFVLVAAGQWQRLAPMLARTLAALLSRDVLATLTGIAAVAMALAGLWADQLAVACSAAVRAPTALATSVQDGLEAMRLLPTMSRQVGGILAEVQEVSRSLTVVEGKVHWIPGRCKVRDSGQKDHLEGQRLGEDVLAGEGGKGLQA